MGKELVPVEVIENKIYLIRGQKVMLDLDLARLYGIETRALKQAVKRNPKRFPDDFMFILTEKEIEALVSQNVTPSRSYFGGSLPFVFTEQGVAMLSSVLNSNKAVQVNVLIMRAFVKLRRLLSTHEELRRKIAEMERKYDGQFKVVFEAIYKLMKPQPKKARKIGFV